MNVLVDKSALARIEHVAVRTRLDDLFERDAVVTCSIIDLELYYSARNAEDFDALWEARHGIPRVDVNEDAMLQAIAIQRTLAEVGQHRRPIPDLIIAATAILNDLQVLHYDQDFEIIAKHVPLDHDWVVPRGTVD